MMLPGSDDPIPMKFVFPFAAAAASVDRLSSSSSSGSSMSTTTDSELPLHGLSSGPEVVVMRRSISIPSQLSLLDTWGSLPAGVLFPLSPMAFAAAAAPTTEDRPPAAPDVPPNPRTARTEGDTLVGSISRTGMRESGQTRAVSDTDASDVWPPPGPAAHNTPPQHPRTTENIGVAPELRRVAEMVRCNQSRLESMVLSVSPPKANVERPVRAALPRSLAHEPDHPDHPDHTDHTDHPDHPGLPEHRAGRYDLQTKIGGGAFSNIYAAVDLEGSSIVAIKVINTLPSFLSSVDGEFAIMSSLDHKNVVKCLGRSVAPRSAKCNDCQLQLSVPLIRPCCTTLDLSRRFPLNSLSRAVSGINGT